MSQEIRNNKMKWTKNDKFTKYIGEKYSYAFAKGLLLISSPDNSLTTALKVKDLKTAKQIAELLEK